MTEDRVRTHLLEDRIRTQMKIIGVKRSCSEIDFETHVVGLLSKRTCYGIDIECVYL